MSCVDVKVVVAALIDKKGNNRILNIEIRGQAAIFTTCCLICNWHHAIDKNDNFSSEIYYTLSSVFYNEYLALQMAVL